MALVCHHAGPLSEANNELRLNERRQQLKDRSLPGQTPGVLASPSDGNQFSQGPHPLEEKDQWLQSKSFIESVHQKQPPVLPMSLSHHPGFFSVLPWWFWPWARP